MSTKRNCTREIYLPPFHIPSTPSQQCHRMEIQTKVAEGGSGGCMFEGVGGGELEVDKRRHGLMKLGPMGTVDK